MLRRQTRSTTAANQRAGLLRTFQAVTPDIVKYLTCFGATHLAATSQALRRLQILSHVAPSSMWWEGGLTDEAIMAIAANCPALLELNVCRCEDRSLPSP